MNGTVFSIRHGVYRDNFIFTLGTRKNNDVNWETQE